MACMKVVPVIEMGRPACAEMDQLEHDALWGSPEIELIPLPLPCALRIPIALCPLGWGGGSPIRARKEKAMMLADTEVR